MTIGAPDLRGRFRGCTWGSSTGSRTVTKFQLQEQLWNAFKNRLPAQCAIGSLLGIQFGEQHSE